jgi:hypothetical protein
MLSHLTNLKDTRSKWLLVQREEIGLSQRMLKAGVPRWALFGQERLAALADAPARARASRHATPTRKPSRVCPSTPAIICGGNWWKVWAILI